MPVSYTHLDVYKRQALQRPVNWITKKTPLKKGLVSGLAVLLALTAIMAVLALIGVRIVEELRGFISLITAKLDNLPVFLKQTEAWILENIHFLPDSIETMAANSIRELFHDLETGAANGRLNIDLSIPVSYTHLDVYKRQRSSCPPLESQGLACRALPPFPG